MIIVEVLDRGPLIPYDIHQDFWYKGILNITIAKSGHKYERWDKHHMITYLKEMTFGNIWYASRPGTTGLHQFLKYQSHTPNSSSVITWKPPGYRMAERQKHRIFVQYVDAPSLRGGINMATCNAFIVKEILLILTTIQRRNVQSGDGGGGSRVHLIWFLLYTRPTSHESVIYCSF